MEMLQGMEKPDSSRWNKDPVHCRRQGRIDPCTWDAFRCNSFAWWSKVQGMSLDQSTSLIGPIVRQRYVVVTEGDKITSVAVEPVPGEVTITAAEKILPLL